MKTHKRYFIAVTLIFAIGGIVAAGTVAAAEEPIWRNFIDETTLSGTLPDDAHLPNTAPIWQAYIETFQKASVSGRAERQSFPIALDETKPIWCEQRKCL
jgi:hypothetical protein